MNKIMLAHDLFDKHIWVSVGYDGRNIQVMTCHCGKYKIIKAALHIDNNWNPVKIAKSNSLIPINTPRNHIIIQDADILGVHVHSSNQKKDILTVKYNCQPKCHIKHVKMVIKKNS